MKTLLKFSSIILLVISCNTYEKSQVINNSNSNEIDARLVKNDTVRISSDEVEYEIIIIEPGFNTWLQSSARPEGYYSQSFLENRNRLYVQSWNQRNLEPQRYDPNLYELRIDYDTQTDYGYELNYKLYNYFIYFQLTYKQKLTSFVPRI